MFIRFSGELLKLRNSSLLGPNRMNNLLKAHNWAILQSKKFGP